MFIKSLNIWRNTHSLILLLPIAAIYFWTFYGVWFWIPMKLRGDTNFYEDIMFKTQIDEYYVQSLIYYTLFAVVFCAYIERFVKHKSSYTNRNKEYIIEPINRLINNKLYIGLVVSCLLGFVFLWKDDIITAMLYNMSAYSVSRFESSTGSKESLAQFLGNIFTYLAIPLLFSNGNKFRKSLILGCFGVFYLFNLALGNRSILLMGMSAGLMLYCEIFGTKKLLRARNIGLGLLLFAIIHFISMIRGHNINDILSGDFEFNLLEVFSSASESSEKDAAQISMYGVLKYDVPFTFGTSVLFLISTIIPSFVGLYRPPRIYEHYVANTIPGGVDIGVTIHHVTAWYLNFGIIGIILGALMWGATLKYLYQRKNSFIFLYGSILFSVASINMIRDGGIECYKGALILGTLIPMFIMHVLLKSKCYKMKLNKKI